MGREFGESQPQLGRERERVPEPNLLELVRLRAASGPHALGCACVPSAPACSAVCRLVRHSHRSMVRQVRLCLSGVRHLRRVLLGPNRLLLVRHGRKQLELLLGLVGKPVRRPAEAAYVDGWLPRVQHVTAPADAAAEPSTAIALSAKTAAASTAMGWQLLRRRLRRRRVLAPIPPGRQ